MSGKPQELIILDNADKTIDEQLLYEKDDNKLLKIQFMVSLRNYLIQVE